YRSTSTPVPTTSPVNSALLTSTSFNDTGRANATTYYYVVQAVDTSGNKAEAAPISATPVSAGPTNIRVNFQPQGASVPTGYVKDFGESFGARTGAEQGSGLTYGWVIPGTTIPRTLVGNARDRDLDPDQRLDTFIHMQYTGGNGVAAPGAWE